MDTQEFDVHKAKYRSGELCVTLPFLMGPVFFGMTEADRWVALCLLSFGKTFTTTPDFIGSFIGATLADVRRVKNELIARGVLKPSELKQKCLDTGVSPFSPPLAMLLKERAVTTYLQQRWVDAYEDKRWIEKEILKAIAWEASATHKKKLFGKFLSNWLSRSSDNKSEPAEKDYGYLDA